MKAAIELGAANKTLGILTSILEDTKDEGTKDEVSGVLSARSASESPAKPSLMRSIVSRLDEYVVEMTDEEISKIVGHLKDWNTNARHSFVAQALINSFFRVLRTERLAKIRPVVEAVKGLRAYGERHLQRIDRLHQAAYLLEYMSSLMNQVCSLN